VRDRRLHQVAGAVELVVPGEVAEPGPGRADLVVGVEVAVLALRGLDQADDLVAGVRALPADGLEPLVDVGVGEPAPAPLALLAAGRQPEVVQVAGVLQPAGAVGDQLLAVQAPPVGPQAAVDRGLYSVEAHRL
jgi:hypothetical protein